MITIEDFKKVDMRVGTIIEAAVNEKARKPAYKLTIDLGELGIKKTSAQITNVYKPEDLIGKQVVVATNLKPVNLRGVESNGMILCATNDKELSFLTIEKEVKNGSKVS